jgi:4-hydroxybenzoate polyprenyltransferase
MFGLLALFGWLARLGPAYFWGIAGAGFCLVYEHRTARRLDVEAVNRAFFWSNAAVGCIFVLAIAVDRFWPVR